MSLEDSCGLKPTHEHATVLERVLLLVNSLALRLILVHATGSSYRRTMEETQSSMSWATTQS